MQRNCWTGWVRHCPSHEDSSSALAKVHELVALMAAVDCAAGLCFYRAEDWWTYELCFQKGVRQFHKDAPQPGAAPGAGLIQISLGQYSPELSDTDKIRVLHARRLICCNTAQVSHRTGHKLQCKAAQTAMFTQVDSSSTRRDVRYVSQLYTGGEPCDITGDTRETEVRNLRLRMAKTGFGLLREKTRALH